MYLCIIFWLYLCKIIYYMGNYLTSFPSQKRPNSRKTKQWYKNCIDYQEQSGAFFDEGIRATYLEKQINTDLYNGILNQEDIVNTINPDGIEYSDISTTLQHYPIINPRIDVLVGEEAKRRFDFTAIVTNPEAVSLKEESRNEELKKAVYSLLSSNYSEEELKRKFQEVVDNFKNYQDKREVRANRLLKHLWNEQKLERKFNAGFKDVFILGEEYYEAHIVSGEPYLKKLDPTKVFYIRSGFSNKIEDSDLIILSDYWSPGQILDNYHEELKSADLDKIENGDTGGSENYNDPVVDNMNMQFSMFDSSTLEGKEKINSLVNMGINSGYNLSAPYDSNGNIRVLKVFWRGWRKVQKVTYFDEQGDPQEDIFPENYIPKKDEGEISKTLWINEWYEGTKIGKDIYVNLRPKQIQYRSMNNPSYCHPGITGRTYSFNSSRTVPMMSKVKNYQYLYDVLHDRLNKAIAKNHGKILEMDFAMIPEGWDPEKWFHYLKKMGIAVKDSFKEGTKGASTGKMAGSQQASKGYIDLETGQYIQQHVALLEFIKAEMSEITGVSDQRLGQIAQTETVGGVERSVTQSSHITEWYFAEHDDVKIEALRILLETAKIAYKGKNKKVQYILDDQSISLFDLDGDEFSENDYGIVVTSSSKTQEAEAKLKQLAEVALNAGAVTFDTVMDIYLSNSISEIKNKIQKSEREKIQREQEQSQKESENIQAKIQQDAADKQADRDSNERQNILDNQTKLQVALLSKDNNEAPVEDNTKEIEKLELDRQKRIDQVTQFYESLEENKRQFDEKLKVEKKKAVQKPVSKSK